MLVEYNIPNGDSMDTNFFTENDDMYAIIGRHFPKHKDIKLIKTGWTNFVFEVETDDGNFFFRFPRNEFFSDALVKESQINKFIEGKIKFQTNHLVLNYFGQKPYTFHRAIDGVSLQDCYGELTDKQKRVLAEDICELLCEFCQVEVEPDFEKVSSFLDRLSDVSRHNYDLSYHEIFKAFEEKELVFSHGDFNQGNLLLKDGKLVAVIDFAFAGVSHPYTDLARIINRSPVDFKPIIMKAYQKRFGEISHPAIIDCMQKSYDYVDNQYIKYIKEYHPNITLQEDMQK